MARSKKTDVAGPVVGENELVGLNAEAFEAYDMQDERIRFDTVGRKWSFTPEKMAVGESVLRLVVERPPGAAIKDTISTAFLASDLGRDMVADVVARMSDALP